MGAKWYYTEFGGFTVGGVQLYSRMYESLGDTMVSGVLAKNISGEYYYEDSNRVYWLRNSDTTFTLLYDFNLEQGDTLVFAKNDTNAPAEYLIDTILYVIVGGDTLKEFYTQAINNEAVVWVIGPYIEGIGGVISLTPRSALADPYPGLRCYSDTSIGLFKYNYENYPCDETIIWSGIEDALILNVSLYPNPASGSLSINLGELPKETLQLEVFSVLGQRMLQQELTKAQTQIDISRLPPGMYLFTLSDKEGRSYSKRLVVD